MLSSVFKPPPVKTEYKEMHRLYTGGAFLYIFYRAKSTVRYTFEFFVQAIEELMLGQFLLRQFLAVFRYFLNAVRRIEFSTTNTELNAIAAAAIIGFSRPATATGIAAEL